MKALKYLTTAIAVILSSLMLFAGYVETLEFGPEGGTKTTQTFTGSSSWQSDTSTKPDWLTSSFSLTSNHGVASLTFTVTVEKNDTSSAREFTLGGLLGDKAVNVIVKQAAKNGGEDPSVPVAKPDLSARSLFLATENVTNTPVATAKVGDDLYLNFSLANSGSVDAGPFVSQLYWDGVALIPVDSGKGLLAGKYEEVLGYKLGTLDSDDVGTHTIRLVVDTGDVVAESDETNNEKTYTITVTDDTPTPPPAPAVKKPNLMPCAFVINTDKDAEDSLEKYTEDDDLYLRFVVCNDGEETAGPFKVNVYQDNEFLFSGDVQYLESKGFIPSPGVHIGKLKAGDHVFRMEVDVTGAVDESDESDNIDDMPITVVADKPEPLKPGQYELKFNPNGGTCLIESKVCNNHDKVGTMPEATLPGKYFWGWYLADGRRIMSGMTVNTDDGSSLTVFAKWGDFETYTVLFDAAGGNCVIESKEYPQGAMVGNLPTATRSGYAFDGWWIEPPYYDPPTQLKPTTWFTVNPTEEGARPAFVVKARWTVVETTSSDLNFGPGYSSTFMVSKNETAFLAGVGGATWSDFKVRSYDGFKCLVDQRVVDAEKTAEGTVDASWCGLFAQMNLCVWTGWSKYIGSTDEDELADYFRSNPSIGDSLVATGLGCIETVLAKAGKSVEDYCSEIDTGADFVAGLQESFESANNGLMLNLVYRNYEFEGVKYDAVVHSVNCYGYVLDSSKKAIGANRLKGLFIVESDNDRFNGVGGVSAPDAITYCPVSWNGSAYEISNIFGAVGTIDAALSLRTEDEQIEEQTKDKKVPGKNANQQTTSDSGVGAKAGVYDGYVQDDDDIVAASIQLKVAKFDAAKGVSKVTATVKSLLDGKSYSMSGKMDAEGHAELTNSKTDMDLTVDILADSFSGEFDGMSVFGGRNAFSEKGSKAAEKLPEYRKTWTVVFSTDSMEGDYAELAAGHSYLNITVGAKGVAKVAGVLADGTKVSLTSQLVFDDDLGYAYVPIVAPLYSKAGGLAMLFQITDDGGAEIVKLSSWEGVYKKDNYFMAELSVEDIVEVTDIPEDVEELEFYADCGDLTDIDGYEVMTEFLPEGTAIKVGKKGKWTLPKAGTVKYNRRDEEFVASNEDNPAGLKLTYKAKDGTFSGSFSVYVQTGDTSLRKYTATVYGVMANGAGYGTAVIKGLGSFIVTIE